MFAEWLWQSIERRPEAVAIETETTSMTYAELAHKIANVGAALRAAGLSKGDRVVLYTEDKIGLLLCHLGIIMAGGVSLPLNPKFTRFEMTWFLNDSGARLAVASGAQAELLGMLGADVPALRTILAPGQLTEFGGSDGAAADIDPDDAAFILYSSGTTGEPKGVVHTHRSLGHAVRAIQRCWRFTPEDVLLNTLSLFHIHGLSFASHTALMTGCRMIVAESFHPVRTMDLMSRATVFYGIPPFYYAFLARPEFRERGPRWTNIRLFTCGSAPIRPEVLPELEAILGRPVINRYGMTESHVITSLPVDGMAKQGSVGLVLEGLEMKLLDEAKKPVPLGTVGEVWIRGQNLFTRYWAKPEMPRHAFDSDCWFATGDLGFLDEDGYLTLRGRRKDLIIVNGYNVYPPVVERVLNTCPGVRESAVVGCPDPRKGERVVAFVVADESVISPDALKQFCSDHMVDYERPWRIQFVDALPRNTMGKVLKAELRKTAEADLRQA